MLYQPGLVFNPKLAIGAGIVYAAIRAAIDFVSGDNKPWSYYLGSAFGGAALATGIPGAAATLHAVGDSVDLLLFHSPDGSDVQIFLNGIQQAQIDAFAVTAGWQTFRVSGLAAGVINRIDIVNLANTNPEKTSPINWLALGPVTVNGSDSFALGGSVLGMDTLAFRLKDSEQDALYQTIPVYVNSGRTLAELQAYVDAIAPEIDAVTGSRIMEVSVVVQLTLPAGLKATPDTLVLNERGGLISFNTSGPRADSFRIPAIKPAIMPGDSFSLSDAAVAALITRLTTGTTAANIRPVTAQGYQYTTARNGKKSFRK